jgi:regulatory protein
MAKKSKYKNNLETHNYASHTESDLKPQTSDLRPHEISLEEALDRLQSFCAYQERCINDVKEKFFTLTKSKSETRNSNLNTIISRLQEEGFLNEERFASSFVKGKFNNNKWGKIKIRYELIAKHIPESIINKALQEIDNEKYTNVLAELFNKKVKEFSSPLSYADKDKIFRFLASKGFESDLIRNLF